MKKVYIMFCVAMVMIILSGCSKSENLAKETTGEEESFNQDTYDLTLQLTPEQQKNFSYAYYEILCSVEGVGFLEEDEVERGDEIYMFMYRGYNVMLDEKGVLHGYYGKEAPYMYNETEERCTMIPLIVMEEKEQPENEIRYTCPVVISNLNNWNIESGDMQIIVNEQYPNGAISEVMHSKEEREIELNDSKVIEIATIGRYLTRGEAGEMINFFDWEETGKMWGLSMSLEDGYHLEMQPLDGPENYYCIFCIEDVDGNMTYSELIPIQQ